jgi:regulator of replication initiation timing
MGAKRPPNEDVTPDTPSNVNDSPSASEPVVNETPQSEPEPSIEDQLTEEDAVELENSVPYQRFKEVNETAKTWKTKATSQEKAFQEKLDDITRIYEAKLAAKPQDDYAVEYDEDPAQKQVRTLESQIKGLTDEIGNLRSSHDNATKSAAIKSLKQQFPKADVLAVKGWHQVYPEAELSDLMEKSHNDNQELIRTSFNELLDRKKERAKKAIINGPSPLKLTEEERPKTIAEATKRAREFLNNV